MRNVLIAISPITYTYGPSLAPALLKACISSSEISATAWDLSAEFNHYYSDHEYYAKVTSWFRFPEMTLTMQEFAWYQDIVNGYANKVLYDYKADVLCLSVMTVTNLRFTEDLSYAVKLANSDIKIIIGGNGISCYQDQYNKKWYQLMLDSGLVDTAIIGEGEISLPRAIEKDQTGVITALQLTNEEFDQVPFPDYSDYDFSYYPKQYRSYWRRPGITEDSTDLIFLITASKGCIKECNFCDVAKWWPKYRVRSGEKIAEEMIYMHKEFGANFFNFTDSLMNGGLKPFNTMNQILSEKLPFTIAYEGQFICRSEKAMPERYFESMAAAGCRLVSIGVESGDEVVREHMGKGSTNADLEYSTEMLLKYNISQDWNIIVGYPTETDESWRTTMNLIKYWVDRGNGSITINPISVFLLLEGTPILDPKSVHDLQLSQTTTAGYSSFNWTTGINKGNTLEVRATRFLELCDYLIDHNPEVYSKHIEPKITEINFQLDQYRNEKAN
jgi:hypothetical protein